jgi:predicted nuclease of predicted toxin-antitoxin system
MSQQPPQLFISLYTDEDVTVELAPALRRRGYIAQSTQEAGNREISDEAQLEYATTQSMAILTYNSQDFIPLAETWFFAGRTHAGIIVSEQFSGRQFGELLRQTLRLLDKITADEIYNQIVYLQQFR